MPVSDSFSLITNRSLWEQLFEEDFNPYEHDECFITATFCTLALENKLRIKRSVVEPHYYQYTVQIYDNDNNLIWENSYNWDNFFYVTNRDQIERNTRYLNKKEGDYIQFPIAFDNWTEFPEMPEFLDGRGVDFIRQYESNMDICFSVKIRSEYVEDEVATLLYRQGSVASSSASLSC